MLKKMMLLALSVGALVAFAAPAVAQANVTLTDPDGVPLEEGAGVTATSTNLVTTIGPLRLTCNKVTLHYEVATNGPDHVVLNPVVFAPQIHNGTFEGCDLTTPGPPHTLHPMNITISGTEQLTINTWGTGLTKATFVSGPCPLSGNVHIQGQAPGTDVINIGPSGLAGAPAPCPPGGVIEGEATLETSNGTPVTLDFSKTG